MRPNRTELGDTAKDMTVTSSWPELFQTIVSAILQTTLKTSTTFHCDKKQALRTYLTVIVQVLYL